MSTPVLEKRATATEQRLSSLAVFETSEIGAIEYYKTAEFERPGSLSDSDFRPCDVGFTWERNRTTTGDDRRSASVDVTNVESLPRELGVGENVWFRLEFTIPESMAGRPVFLRFIAEPLRDLPISMGTARVECLCYRDGTPWQAFDDGHTDLLLTEDADGGESYELLVEAGTTTLWGQLDVEEFVLDTAQLVAFRPTVRTLSRNVSLLNDLWQELSEDSLNRSKILRAITEASHVFEYDAETESGYERSAEAALDRLNELKSNLRSELTGHELATIGHAHLDLAYLWPWSETVRKGARSFSNVLKLMEEYPGFTFLQSQPHLYEMMRTQYPEVYESITDRIDEGRWEPVGALWVESDVNLVGGEALARQFLLGKRYFRREFDVDPQVAFIPDVFGYSAGLPTIAQAADCPYFLTQKMSWNEHNEFPYSTFHWEGLDGSTVLSHFPPADTYNGEMTVDQVRKSVTNHAENDRLDESAYLVGWGDGGGGPTREILENRKILDEIGSLPDIEMGSLRSYFERVAATEADLPTWTGELYLEKHQGTLTTQARTKRNNRKGEFALREAEVWSSLARALPPVEGFEYPQDRLTRAWKLLLFNQFHDILPGSSVPDVYADADREYEQLFETTDTVRANAVETLLNPVDSATQVAVTNSLSWSQSPVVELDPSRIEIEDPEVAVTEDGTRRPVQPVETDDGGAYLVEIPDVPPFGVSTVGFEPSGSTSEEMDDDERTNPLDVSTSHIENGRIRVDLAADGTMQATDLETGREVFDGPGNRLVSYRDQPAEYDAWDVEGDLYDVGEELPSPVETDVIEDGPVRATVRQVRAFGDSELVQDISLTAGSKRIDCRTEVTWQEDERFLKTHFPMAVHTNEATYHTHFGHVTRETHDNTSWDVARHEEPHQHWVDVSEPGYGVAVLNDCKYGVNVAGTDIGLSLLRAPEYPDPDADRETHEFEYAVYPHEGDLQAAGVTEEGYEFNAPVTAVPVEDTVEYAPIDIDGDGVILESIKRAEESDDELVLRLYEAWGRETTAQLSLEFPVDAAVETNLVEDERGELELSGEGALELDLAAFDLRTIKLMLA